MDTSALPQYDNHDAERRGIRPWLN